MRITNLIAVVLITVILTTAVPALAQKTITVRPVEIDEVLINPGIGFMTFQRFNGDELNEGIRWTEGFPIAYQKFDGNLENKDHPLTSMAYFRVYWKFIEPEMEKYRWDLIDKALETAEQRGQSLLLRIAPYGGGPDKDVPDWFRQMVGEEKKLLHHRWRVDPEDTRYAKYFGGMIRAMGRRYDGHPNFEGVDVSIVGFWGEGAGSELVTQEAMEALVDAYVESFRKTHLIMLLTDSDKKTNVYGRSKANVGWRSDCLGDLGFWAAEQNGWNHMYDYYPQAIINFEMKDAWKTAPVTFEICGTFGSWKQKQGYDKDDVKYIFDQALKWHISSFNAKSSPVLDEWKPLVDEWLKKMGYRFVLRKFTYPDVVRAHGKLDFTTWWENKGVAPCYKDFLLALRLKNDKRAEVLITAANIKTWLPDDNLYDDAVLIPLDMPAGEYNLQIAIVDRFSFKPKVKLAIEGRDPDGWYTLGKIKVQD